MRKTTQEISINETKLRGSGRRDRLMELLVNYKGNSKGYELASGVSIDIQEDAEALGYALCVVMSVHAMLEQLAKTANPKYRERILRGIEKAMKEKENNPVWPFEKFRLEDGK